VLFVVAPAAAAAPLVRAAASKLRFIASKSAVVDVELGWRGSVSDEEEAAALGMKEVEGVGNPLYRRVSSAEGMLAKVHLELDESATGETLASSGQEQVSERAETRV
jgi:hypothetical protein